MHGPASPIGGYLRDEEIQVRRFRQWLSALKFECDGLMALEYGLIMAIIGAVALTGAELLGGALNSSYAQVGNNLTTEVASS
jgi:Flp pilus assembly pilin Flp